MAVFQGALCSFPHPSQRDGSRSRQSAGGPASCCSLVPDTPVWTHFWQMAAPQGLQIVWDSCEMPPGSSSTAAYVTVGVALGFCAGITSQTPQVSSECPTGLDFCPWGWQQLACRQESGGKWRGTALYRSAIPSTSCFQRHSDCPYGCCRVRR